MEQFRDRPAQGTEYELECLLTQNSIDIEDDFPLSSLPECPTDGPTAIAPSIGLSTETALATPNFENTTISDAIPTAYAKLGLPDSTGSGTFDNPEGVSLFHEILTYSYSSLTSTDSLLLDQSFLYMLEAVENAFVTGEVSLSDFGGGLTGILGLAAEVNDTLLAGARAGNHTEREVMCLSIKSHLYRLSGNRTESIAYIDSAIAADPESDFASVLSGLKCVVKIEDDVLEGHIQKEEFSSYLEQCTLGAGKSGLSPRKLTKSEGETGKLFVYPNPVADELTVEIDTKGESEVEIISITGAVVIKLRVTGAAVANLSALPNGVYIVQAKALTGDIIGTRRIVKQ